MDKFVKRIQTRLSRKDVRVSKSQVREVYESVVAAPESPSEEEMSAVIQQLETQYQAPSHEPTASELTVTDQPTQLQQREVKDMPLAQPTQEPVTNTLATSNRPTLSQAPSANLSVTQEEIVKAVEEEFGKQNFEVKTAILNHVLGDTYSTATELKMALSKLRELRLDVLLKVVSDHNSQASNDEALLKTALLKASSERQKATEDFFGSFDAQLVQMRANFGI